MIVLSGIISRPNDELLASQQRLYKSYDALAIMARAEQWWQFEGSELSPSASGALAYSSHQGKACLMVWGLPTGDDEHYDAYATIDGISEKVGYLYPAGRALRVILDRDPAQFDQLEVYLTGPGGTQGPLAMNVPLSDS